MKNKSGYAGRSEREKEKDKRHHILYPEKAFSKETSEKRCLCEKRCGCIRYWPPMFAKDLFMLK